MEKREVKRRKLKEVRLAIPTKGSKGMEDAVSNVFGRAEKFTVVEVRDGSIVDVKVVENPAISYSHGAGPIAVKTLVDMGVNAIVASELGIGVSMLLDQKNIRKFKVKAGVPVREAVGLILKELEAQTSLKRT